MLDTYINLKLGSYAHKGNMKRLKEYKKWINENNVKHEFIFYPAWSMLPSKIKLSSHDALAFRFKFML